MQISRISYNESDFPDQLRDLADHKNGIPKQIYTLGTLPKHEEMVAIVGTRDMTEYGRRVTYQLASELSKAGAVIVSGLARGVDSIAHRAALDAGGRTVAVLGNPLNRIYPSDNRPMAREILRTGGALVSEYGVDEDTHKWNFAQRNRIVAALSKGVIVTESGADGGALITARDAAKLSRIVMAVPGNITSVTSAGTNQIIHSENAMLVRSASDVIVALGFHAREQVTVPARSPEEAQIYKLLESGITTSEQLIEAGNFGAAQFANIISLMEITGKVRNLGAGNWVIR